MMSAQSSPPRYIYREKERALFFTFNTCVCLAHPQRPCLVKVNLNNFAKNSLPRVGKGVHF